VSQFSSEFEVRDYECDLQGIVNNANYQHYLEHNRHQFLQSRGIDFAELSREGIQLIVVRAELDYKVPLRPGDWFRVEVSLERMGRIRFIFHQRILRLPDLEDVLIAKTITSAMDNKGRPLRPKEWKGHLAALAGELGED
jgi:acyl-CoA thioester hydrolase